jgi:predicted nucleic acid-binding protein
MTALVFVDTNVLVYAVDRSEVDKRLTAHAWLQHLWRQDSGRTSVQVIRESYAVLCRPRRGEPILSRNQARDWVSTLFTWRPCPISLPLLRDAMAVQERFALSWWDSLIVAAAQTQSCEYLLTEDLQDGQVIDGLTIVNPFAHQPADFA